MKRIFTLDVKTNCSQNVKRHAVVITSYRTNSSSKEKVKHEEQVSYNHVTVQETEDSGADIKLAEAPDTLEDGGKP